MKMNLTLCKKPQDNTPGKLFEFSNHWDVYVKWHDPKRWKKLMRPAKLPLKYQLRIWRENFGQKLLNWGCKVLLYGYDAPIWKFILARPVVYIGYFILQGPSWWRAAQAIRTEARERMHYRGYSYGIQYRPNKENINEKKM